MTVHYLSPGPSRLADPVREKIRGDLLDSFGFGVSIMEISHRSEQFSHLLENTLGLISRVLGIPDSHALLLTPFGAQQHFSLLIHHLSELGDTISYADTGVWAGLAVRDAKGSGRKVEVVFDGAPHFSSLGNTREYQVDPKSRYLHLTVNNTVYGTEYPKIPDHFSVPLVLDMTSSLAARTDIPWNKVGMVYASAQKNFGIAGVSLVIIRKDLLNQSLQFTSASHLGEALKYYRIHEKNSALNTPPVFAISVTQKVFQWIEEVGGVAEMERLARAKADLVYGQVDGAFYRGLARTDQRSRHNFVFTLQSNELNTLFVAEAKKENILEIKGYRDVGGIRASFYTGVSLESAKAFADYMTEFRRRHG